MDSELFPEKVYDIVTALETVQALQNPNGNPALNGGFRELNWNRKVAEANSFFPTEFADVVRANCASVRNELEAFRAAKESSPTEHAIRCFLFAIVSPQCNFSENVVATQKLIDNYSYLDDYSVLLDCLTVPFHGEGTPRLVNLGVGKAAYIAAAMPFLDSLNDDNLAELFTFENIHAHKGMGDKTASMCMALFDEQSEVFTLDQWMLRLTLALNGNDPRATIRTTAKGYHATKDKWLTFCKEHLSDLSPFVTQWTSWNLCFGNHVSHLGILGA